MTVSLEKRAQAAGVVLAKRGLMNVPTMRVGMALDVSGSMKDEWYDGTVQNAVDQLLGLSLQFDDDGDIDSVLFDSNVHKAKSATKDSYGTYAQEILKEHRNIWGATNFAGPIKTLTESMFGGGGLGGLFSKAPTSAVPSLIFLITDGENNDKEQAERALQEAQKHPIYFQLVGVGARNQHLFKWLVNMADKYPNVGHVFIPDLKMSDEKLYEAVLTEELITWVKKNR